MYDLIAVGSVTKDIFLVTDRGKVFKTPRDKLAPEWLGFELGEKIRADEIQQCIGGVATDISIGLSKLGIKAFLFSTIGKDFEGKWIIENLKKKKVDLTGIGMEEKRKTPLSVILSDKKTGERIIFTQNSSGDLNLAPLPRFRARYIFVSSLKGKIREQTKKILDYVRKYNADLIVNPSTSQIRDDFADLKKLLRISKVLILNKNEALEIASKLKKAVKTEKDLFKILFKLGPDTIAITNGRKGAWASDGKKIIHSPVKKVKIVDVTGAGDAFAGGFLGFYIRGEKLEKCLRAGIVNSASVVGHIGTTKGLLMKKDLDRSM